MVKSTFVFDSFYFDREKRTATFHYSIIRESETVTFTEKLEFPLPIDDQIPQTLIDQLVFQLHIVLGISYYKLYCPSVITILSGHLTKKQAEFWKNVYTNGLGEFFYKNNIDFRDLIHFPSEESISTSISFRRAERSLVGIGGGKDSLVSIELLKKAKKKFTGFVIETKRTYEVVEDVGQIAEIDIIHVKRTMDPKIDEYNGRPDTYNGHIPISAVYACTGLLLGVLYDYSYVIASNERSASYGNVEYLGHTINHQWSKSREFEELFQKFVKESITQDVTYFSLLRPFYELAIVKEFVKYPQYFTHFSSCNRHFKLNSVTHTLWCGECPKCAFVYLLLSAYIPRNTLLNIFGNDLFDQENLVQTYRELIGISGIKPFECVGTPEEAKVAFYLAYEKGGYDHTRAMNMYVNDCLPEIKDIETMKQDVLAVHESRCLPKQFKDVCYEH